MTWHTARLGGPYLAGTRVLVLVDDEGRIIACKDIKSQWSHTTRFDEPFRADYDPTIIYDGGEEYERWQGEAKARRAAQSNPDSGGGSTDDLKPAA